MKTKLILFLAVIIYSCKSNPLTTEIVKDPKTYNWSVDTIDFHDPTMLQASLSSIWGSSENDVYAAGHTDSGSQIIHFNGSKWEVFDKVKNGIRFSFGGECAYGFSGNDVWISGTTQADINSIYYPDDIGAVCHFDGTKWTQFDLPTKTMSFGGFIWGTSSNNIWTCGNYGTYAHYDGQKWNVDTIKINGKNNTHIYLQYIIQYNNNIYANGFYNPISYFYQKSGNGWICLDSININNDYKWGNGRFIITSDNNLWSYGDRGVWSFTNNSWSKLLSVEHSISGIIEYTKGNFIITDFYGKVYQYSNGTFETIKDFGTNPYLYGVWANDKECFILANKIGSGINSKTLVYHGK